MSLAVTLAFACVLVAVYSSTGGGRRLILLALMCVPGVVALTLTWLVHHRRPRAGTLLDSLTSGQFALAMAACLIAVIVCSESARIRCDVLHRIVVDGRTYAGGCTGVGGYRGELAVMGLAPVSAALALSRPGSSLRRSLGLMLLLALEFTAIGVTVPGRALAHPHLIRADPGTGRPVLILAE